MKLLTVPSIRKTRLTTDLAFTKRFLANQSSRTNTHINIRAVDSKGSLKTSLKLPETAPFETLALNRRRANIRIPFSALHKFIKLQPSQIKQELIEYIRGLLSAGHLPFSRECCRGSLAQNLDWEIKNKAASYYLQKQTEIDIEKAGRPELKARLSDLADEWPFLFYEPVTVPTEALAIVQHVIRNNFWYELHKTNFFEKLAANKIESVESKRNILCQRGLPFQTKRL